MGDFFKDFGKSISNVAKSVANEAGRAVNEAGRHITESIDEIAKATEEGGIVAGLGTAADKFSPGNMLAGAVDSVIPGEDLPTPLAEGISAGGNLLFSALVPGAGLVGVMALVDGYQALSSMGGEGAGAEQVRAEGGQRMQTPESPGSALERAQGGKREARAEATRGAIHEARAEADTGMRGNTNIRIGVLEGRVAYLEELAGVQESKPGGGYGGVDDINLGVGGGFISNDFIKGEIGGSRGKGTSKLDKLERELAEANAEIEKILNNPNLAFEDMIFLLMKAVIKQSESEVKIGLEQEKGTRDADRGARDAGRGEINGMQNQLKALNTKIGAEADPKKKEALQLEAQNLRTGIEQKTTVLSDDIGDKTDSRGERFEELKESLQKIGEMQQALSNIMNALHQTAQNAIGNIR